MLCMQPSSFLYYVSNASLPLEKEKTSEYKAVYIIKDY